MMALFVCTTSATVGSCGGRGCLVAPTTCSRGTAWWRRPHWSGEPFACSPRTGASTARSESRARQTTLVSCSAVSAAPAVDGWEPAELGCDVGAGRQPARAGRADEQPLIGGRPNDEEPAPVGGRDDLGEAARGAEEQPPAP